MTVMEFFRGDGKLIWRINCPLFLFFSWVPVFVDNDKRLSVMSIGFLLSSKDDAVIWRGPKKTGKFAQKTIRI